MAERHGYVTKHSERGDERSRELVGLLHLDLVVSGISIKERKVSHPAVESTIWSIRGNGKGFLGHALFKLV